jgi:hypothetical protein
MDTVARAFLLGFAAGLLAADIALWVGVPFWAVSFTASGVSFACWWASVRERRC